LLAYLIRRFAQSRANEQRYASDLEAARTLQQILIPESLPSIPGLQIETAYHPAQEVGGDFYQILPLCAFAPDGPAQTLIILGDVAGNRSEVKCLSLASRERRECRRINQSFLLRDGQAGN
jgi:serine phosphatase RsbU (regulator of sigma subunit)